MMDCSRRRMVEVSNVSIDKFSRMVHDSGRSSKSEINTVA